MALLSKHEKQTETGYVCNNWLSCLCLQSIVHGRDAESTWLLTTSRVPVSRRREARLEALLPCLSGENNNWEAAVLQDPKSALSLMVLTVCHRDRKLMAARSLRGDVIWMQSHDGVWWSVRKQIPELGR